MTPHVNMTQHGLGIHDRSRRGDTCVAVGHLVHPESPMGRRLSRLHVVATGGGRRCFLPAVLPVVCDGRQWRLL